MLFGSADSLVVPEEDKPWILARLQFASGLLQPSNVRLLRLPRLFDPLNALRFLLLAEWHNSGRELWPSVCSAINEPDNALSCEDAAPCREWKRREENVDRKRAFFRSVSSGESRAPKLGGLSPRLTM